MLHRHRRGVERSRASSDVSQSEVPTARRIAREIGTSILSRPALSAVHACLKNGCAEKAIAGIAQRVEALGGRVSYKNNSDGSQSAYELNINYLDALGIPGTEETDELIAKRFLTSQAIMLAL